MIRNEEKEKKREEKPKTSGWDAGVRKKKLGAKKHTHQGHLKEVQYLLRQAVKEIDRGP